eukprot:NODE_6414_length_512_cov_63.969762_g5639_i0.p1 GENE.NODE_6414_length_512_cov_63.969762_g5639_i0~~NODE_6414_length_512_cov_63.969762_g5639_i0.p1  ORF type:complete len:150 (+),score=7.10 NODE_6414_length_512_cov_63.969762_g5639_i0:8-457(+)
MSSCRIGNLCPQLLWDQRRVHGGTSCQCDTRTFTTVAMTFSVERYLYECPMGVHKPWNYLKKSEYQTLVERCPELASILGHHQPSNADAPSSDAGDKRPEGRLQIGSSSWPRLWRLACLMMILVLVLCLCLASRARDSLSPPSRARPFF